MKFVSPNFRLRGWTNETLSEDWLKSWPTPSHERSEWQVTSSSNWKNLGMVTIATVVILHTEAIWREWCSVGGITASTVSMKKKLSYGSQQQARGGRWRTGGITSLIVVILLVVLMLSTIIPGPGHDHDQQQEAKSVLQISTVSRAPKTEAPKVAFLFLARNQMPLDFLWEHFFQVREMPCGFIILVFILWQEIQWCFWNGVLSELWLFWQGSNSEHSVYIHARPGFVYTQDNTKCPSFVNRQLNNSILVYSH